MPQELDNQFKMPTAAEIEAMPGDRETKAARNIMVRNITGIPRKAFLTGDNDHAPILNGVKDLTTVCYALSDAIDNANLNDKRNELPTVEEWGRILDANAEMIAILEHHGA